MIKLKLRQIRLSQKLTQEKLAIFLNVNRSTLAMWEIARAEPNISMILKIAKILNVSVDELLKNE